MAFTRVEGLAQHLQPKNLSLRRYKIQSELVSVKLSDTDSISDAPIVLEFVLHHLSANFSSAARVCAWLVIDNATWSVSGCEVQLEKSSINSTSCRCHHLTNFAVLMDFTGSMARVLKEEPYHARILTVLTVVGCVIAIICLTLALVTFIVIRKYRSSRDTLHQNVCLCLLLGELFFVVSALVEPHQLGQIACAVIAGSLHYLFLSAFFWMLCEGVELWFLVVKVFQTVSRNKIYYPFAYCK